MAIVPSNEFKHVATPLFIRDDKVLLSANLVLVDSDTSDRVLAGDDLSLVVNDVDGNAFYILNKATIPAIIDDLNNTYHYVEDIDVTAMPDGTITLVWTALIGGETIQHQQCIDFHQPGPVTIVHGQSDSESDYNFNQDTTKRVYFRFRDQLGTIIDPDSNTARVRITDDTDGSEKLVVAATRESQGYYYVDLSLAAGTFDISNARYCLLWEGQIPGGGFIEAQNSRVSINVRPQAERYYADLLTFSTNQDIRNLFPTIDEFLARENLQIPERELILNQRRVEANAIVKELYGRFTGASREVLKQMEAYMAIKNTLIAATAFSRFPSTYIEMYGHKLRTLDRIITGKNAVIATRYV